MNCDARAMPFFFHHTAGYYSGWLRFRILGIDTYRSARGLCEYLSKSKETVQSRDAERSRREGFIVEESISGKEESPSKRVF